MKKQKLIEKSQAQFGTYIDFSHVPENAEGQIRLVCKWHGDFFQDANTHLKRQIPCPKCSEEYWSTNHLQKLYLLVDYKRDCIKIGISVEPRVRAKKLGCSLVFYQLSPNAKAQEQELLRLTEEYIVEGEYRDWEQLPIVMEYFKNLTVFYNPKIIKYYKFNLESFLRTAIMPTL